MSLTEDLRHRHTWLAGDGEKIRASDLDWWAYLNTNFFAFDIWAQFWANADGAYRDIIFPWINNDTQADYTAKTVLTWLWTSTGKYSQRMYFDSLIFDGTDILVKSWRIVSVVASLNYSTGSLKLALTGWSFRYLEWTSTDLTQATPRVTFMNASNQDTRIRLKYADSWANRPIFGAYIQIR